MQRALRKDTAEPSSLVPAEVHYFDRRGIRARAVDEYGPQLSTEKGIIDRHVPTTTVRH